MTYRIEYRDKTGKTVAAMNDIEGMDRAVYWAEKYLSQLPYWASAHAIGGDGETVIATNGTPC